MGPLVSFLAAGLECRHGNKVIPVRMPGVTVRPVKFPTYGCFAPKKLIYKINKVNLIQ